MRGTIEPRDKGFSMVELLVAIVIVGILAAVAIPLYLNHSSKAFDSTAQSDTMTLGTLIRAAYGEGPVSTVELVDGEYLIDGEAAFGASPGVELVTWHPGTADTWCVQLRHPDGDRSADPGERFDAQRGYVEGASCATP